MTAREKINIALRIGEKMKAHVTTLIALPATISLSKEDLRCVKDDINEMLRTLKAEENNK